MPSQLTLGVILALLLSTAGLGWYAKHQTERAAVAQAAIADAQAAGEAWRLALEQQTTNANQLTDQLSESTQGYDDLRRTTDRRIRKYEHAARSTPGDAGWDAARVPAAVAERLCEYTDQDPGADRSAEDPAPIHRPHPDPCHGADRYFSNGDLWRWTERLIEGWGRFNADRGQVQAIGQAANP